MRWPWTALFRPTRPARRSRDGFRPRLQLLEDRLAPATVTVTSTGDDTAVNGSVSLREAILSINAGANTNADVVASGTYGTNDTINFNITGAGPQQISLTSALPALVKKVTINGLSQTNAAAGAPLIVLNGSGAGAGVDGLTLGAGSDGSTVTGLVIQAFTGNGLVLNGSSGNTVSSNFIGTNAAGNATSPNGGVGVLLNAAAKANTVGGVTAAAANVISGNLGGVEITGSGTTANTVEGNIIGMDKSGSQAALGNTNADVVIAGGATANTVGGTTTTAGNTLAATVVGVLIAGTGTSQNVVEGNFVGTDVLGITQHGTAVGVAVGLGATANTVGGTAAGAGNVLSGNVYGVYLAGAGSNNNTVAGNLIGTDVSGTLKLPNQIGVVVTAGSSSNAVGVAGAGNTISANAYGVVLVGTGTTSNVVAGNQIGTQKNGVVLLGNTFVGVVIDQGAASNTVGGTTSAEANVIAGGGIGVVLEGASTTRNALQGNKIGVSATGNVPLANFVGVVVQNGAVGNTVGGAASGAGNTIANSTGLGVAVVGSGTTGGSILSNLIFNNGGLGIDLGADGPTANGTNPRTFPNNGQNFPTITSSGGTTVSGTLTSTPGTSFTIQYFGTPLGSSAAHQGQTFLGSDTVTTDATGNITFTSTVSSIPSGDLVNATATNQATGDTSEFSS